MAVKKNARDRFIELMYVLLYAMLMQRGDSGPKFDYRKKMSEICSLKNDIEISCSNISDLVKTAESKSKVFANNPVVLNALNDTLDFYNTWKIYHDNNKNVIENLIYTSGGYDENNEIKFPDNKDSVSIFLKDKGIDSMRRFVSQISSKIKDYDFPKDDEVIKKVIDKLNNFGVYRVKAENGDIIDKSNELFVDDELIHLVYYLYSEDFAISSCVRTIIAKLMEKAKLNQPVFDNFELIVIPKKHSVVAGKNYEATVFLNAKDYVKIDGEEPIIKVNGTPVSVNDYIANISYPTSRDLSFDENGNCNVTIKIEYSQRNPYSDKYIHVEKDITFVVVNKNDIEGVIKSTDLFYKNCANKYIVKNGDPELNNNLSYRVNGGRLLSTNDKGKGETELVIYPTDNVCKIVVYNDGIELNNFEFKTIETPMPLFDILINDRVVVDQSEIYSTDIQDIAIDVNNEETFELNYPLDSKNVVKDWVIELKDSSKRTFDSIIVSNSNSYTLTDENKRLINSCRCCYIYIRVSNVVRQHRDTEISSPEEIPLIKSYEVLSRQIKVLHKNNNQNFGGQNLVSFRR